MPCPYEDATIPIISDFDTADEAVEEEVPVVVSEVEIDSHLIPAEIVKQETSSDIEQGEIHYNQVNKVSLHTRCNDDVRLQVETLKHLRVLLSFL